MTFSKVFQFFYGSGIEHELPLRRQVWICDALSWWLIQKNLPGIAPTPQPFTPKGLRVLKVAVLQKSSCPFADLYQHLYIAAKCIEKGV